MRKSLHAFLSSSILAAAFAAAGAMPTAVYGQAVSTASRAGDLQIGGGFTLADADYNQPHFIGGDVYVDFNPRSHWGIEAIAHQVKDTRGNAYYNQVYERTYEVGGRYFRTYGRLVPYVKGMYGRGVFNYPKVYVPAYGGLVTAANLAYNLVAVGGGADYRLTRRINLRADYEYQRWFSFPQNGLTPQLFTIGAAYHFPGELRIR